MAQSCDPNDLATAAKCFACAPNLQIQTYLLAVIAGGSTDPNVLATQSVAFQDVSPLQLLQMQVWLLCQILNK